MCNLLVWTGRRMARAGALLVLVSSLHTLHAQVQCSGPDCAQRITAHQRVLIDFESLYLSELFRDLAASQALANITALPGQGIVLENYALGVGLGAGYTARREIPLRDQDMQLLLLPEMGVSLTTGYHGAVNLGWAVSFWYALFARGPCCGEKSDPAPETNHTRVPILSRLDLYVGGVRGFSSKKNPGSDSVRDFYRSHGRQDSTGYGLRIHLLKKRKFLPGVLSFAGLSGGLHAQKSAQSLNLNSRNLLGNRPGLPAGLNGDSGFEFTVDSEMNSATMDLRTGIQLLRFFHVGLSVGAARHSGKVRIRVARRLLEGERRILLESDRKAPVEFKMNYVTTVVGVGGFFIQSTVPLGRRRGPGSARGVSLFYVLHY